MLYCILAKFLATFAAVLFLVRYDLNHYLQAFLIGVLPIWSEVLASRLTRVEPARETRSSLLFADALADSTSFLIAPAIWFLNLTAQHAPFVLAALVLFVGAGLFRIYRFLRQGLDANGYFTGLPVTYTGYVWIILIGAGSWDLNTLPALVLALLSWAMVSKRIRIRASR